MTSISRPFKVRSSSFISCPPSLSNFWSVQPLWQYWPSGSHGRKRQRMRESTSVARVVPLVIAMLTSQGGSGYSRNKHPVFDGPYEICIGPQRHRYVYELHCDSGVYRCIRHSDWGSDGDCLFLFQSTTGHAPYHKYIHEYTYIHAYTHTYVHKYMHAHMHESKHTYIAYVPTNMHM